MSEHDIVQHATGILLLVLLLSLPTLIVAASVGLVVGLIQAVTQIQDQTMPQAIKLVAVLLTLIFAGPWMAQPLIQHAQQIFDEFPLAAR